MCVVGRSWLMCVFLSFKFSTFALKYMRRHWKMFAYKKPPFQWDICFSLFSLNKKKSIFLFIRFLCFQLFNFTISHLYHEMKKRLYIQAKKEIHSSENISIFFIYCTSNNWQQNKLVYDVAAEGCNRAPKQDDWYYFKNNIQGGIRE